MAALREINILKNEGDIHKKIVKSKKYIYKEKKERKKKEYLLIRL
jgi:hypothetical protein